MPVMESDRLNIAQLAMQVAVSRQTLYTWQKEGCPLEEGAEAVREWRAEHKSAETSTIKQQQDLAKLRKLEAEARKLELDNMEREGALLPRADVIREAADSISQAKPILEYLPDDFSKELPQEFRAVWRQLARVAVDRVLRKLAGITPGGADA